MPTATATGEVTAPPAPSESVTASSGATPISDSGSGDTACVSGRWRLDLADYQAQAASWMKGLGIPVRRLRIKGSQILTINPGYLSVGTDLMVVASVPGATISARNRYAGSGDWYWRADRPDILDVENWQTTVDDADTTGSVPAVPLFDVSAGGVKVRCDGDRLVLRGAGAPLVGRFDRIG